MRGNDFSRLIQRSHKRGSAMYRRLGWAIFLCAALTWPAIATAILMNVQSLCPTSSDEGFPSGDALISQYPSLSDYPQKERSLGRVLCLQPIVCHSTVLMTCHSAMLTAGHPINFRIGLDLEEKDHTRFRLPNDTWTERPH